MAYNNSGYYPYQDPRFYPQYPQQQYRPPNQSPQFPSPHGIEVQIPRASQYDGATSPPPVQAYPNFQYQQPGYAQRQHQQQHGNYQQPHKQPNVPPKPPSAKPSKTNVKESSKQTPSKPAEKPAAKPAVKPQVEPREIDYALLLVDLAEDYLSAAYGQGSADPLMKDVDYARFCKLIATGLGCLEVVLKVCNTPSALRNLDTDLFSNGRLLCRRL